MTASHALPQTRRERRKLALRMRIAEVASELFSERGFHATKVAEICEQADIAHKTFFNHFPSKQDVLREIAHQGVASLLEDLEEARKAEVGTREQLSLFFETVAESVAGGGPMNRELVTELVHVLNAGDAKTEQAELLIDAFGAIVADGIAAGDVTRRHDADTLTEMILGAYYVLIFNFSSLEGFPIRKQAQSIARFLGDALAPRPDEVEDSTTHPRGSTTHPRRSNPSGR